MPAMLDHCFKSAEVKFLPNKIETYLFLHHQVYGILLLQMNMLYPFDDANKSEKKSANSNFLLHNSNNIA